jgi:hypothetical protein
MPSLMSSLNLTCGKCAAARWCLLRRGGGGAVKGQLFHTTWRHLLDTEEWSEPIIVNEQQPSGAANVEVGQCPI